MPATHCDDCGRPMVASAAVLSDPEIDVLCPDCKTGRGVRAKETAAEEAQAAARLGLDLEEDDAQAAARLGEDG